MAFVAASRKSLTMWGISSVVRWLGGVNSATSRPLERIWGVSGLSVQEIGSWPLGWKPVDRSQSRRTKVTFSDTLSFSSKWVNDLCWKLCLHAKLGKRRFLLCHALHLQLVSRIPLAPLSIFQEYQCTLG